MQYNVNGWPIAPERGKYLGEIDDIYYVKVNEFGRYYEPNLWCRRRVYKDELEYLNSNKTIKLKDYQNKYQEKLK